MIVDPTLVIGKDVWDANIPTERKINEDYIFCYFLGDNKMAREMAIAMKKKTGKKIHQMNSSHYDMKELLDVQEYLNKVR